jgi:hypothetical protein
MKLVATPWCWCRPLRMYGSKPIWPRNSPRSSSMRIDFRRRPGRAVSSHGMAPASKT